jgi:hypothetical protein
MLSLITIRYPGKCALCKEEFSAGETAFKFPWKGKKIIAGDLCTETCVPTLHPNYEPPSKSSPDV